MKKLLVVVVMPIVSCSKFKPEEPSEEDVLDAPMNGLSYEENRRFQNGDKVFNEEIFTVEKGLGPIFLRFIQMQKE